VCEVGVGGTVGKPGGTVQHCEKVAGREIQHGSAAIWWKKGIPMGTGAAKLDIGMMMICWEVGEMEWPIWGKNIVTPTGMAHNIFGHSRRPRSPPPHTHTCVGCLLGAPNEEMPTAR
jgi:hypothetical protein